MSNTLIVEVVQQMENLPPSLQRQVLDFVKQLSSPIERGVSGEKLLRFANLIPADDLEIMHQAIEQDCQQVDLNEW
jgi:hypothetical protein